MQDVLDYAKYFIQKNASDFTDTFDGNMKLQKLLAFADLVFLAEYGTLLFAEDVLAFRNGCVVEKIRCEYKNEYNRLISDSMRFRPNFTEEEYDALNLVINIFGKATARELSAINHEFDSWKDAYQSGINLNGFHEKKRSVVNFESHEEDLEIMKNIISSFKESEKDAENIEIINGTTFYYDGFLLTDDTIDMLEVFSENAEDNAYTVYYDEGELVIY